MLLQHAAQVDLAGSRSGTPPLANAVIGTQQATTTTRQEPYEFIGFLGGRCQNPFELIQGSVTGHGGNGARSEFSGRWPGGGRAAAGRRPEISRRWPEKSGKIRLNPEKSGKIRLNPEKSGKIRKVAGKIRKVTKKSSKHEKFTIF